MQWTFFLAAGRQDKGQYKVVWSGVGKQRTFFSGVQPGREGAMGNEGWCVVGCLVRSIGTGVCDGQGLAGYSSLLFFWRPLGRINILIQCFQLTL